MACENASRVAISDGRQQTIIRTVAHHDVVEDGTDDGSHHLSQEGVPGGNLQVDTQFQVLEQVDGLNLRVVTVHGGVHVGYGVTRQHVGGEHLVETGTSRDELTETEDTSEEGVDGGEDEGDQEDDDQGPPRSTGFARIVGGLSHGKGADQDQGEPPSRDGRVLEHLKVVLVGDVAVVLFARSKQGVSPTVGKPRLEARERNTLEQDRDAVGARAVKRRLASMFIAMVTLCRTHSW